jgi:hypothetical protein
MKHNVSVEYRLKDSNCDSRFIDHEMKILLVHEHIILFSLEPKKTDSIVKTIKVWASIYCYSK